MSAGSSDALKGRGFPPAASWFTNDKGGGSPSGAVYNQTSVVDKFVDGTGADNYSADASRVGEPPCQSLIAGGSAVRNSSEEQSQTSVYSCCHGTNAILDGYPLSASAELENEEVTRKTQYLKHVARELFLSSPPATPAMRMGELDDICLDLASPASSTDELEEENEEDGILDDVLQNTDFIDLTAIPDEEDDETIVDRKGKRKSSDSLQNEPKRLKTNEGLTRSNPLADQRSSMVVYAIEGMLRVHGQPLYHQLCAIDEYHAGARQRVNLLDAVNLSRKARSSPLLGDETDTAMLHLAPATEFFEQVYLRPGRTHPKDFKNVFIESTGPDASDTTTATARYYIRVLSVPRGKLFSQITQLLHDKGDVSYALQLFITYGAGFERCQTLLSDYCKRDQTSHDNVMIDLSQVLSPEMIEVMRKTEKSDMNEVIHLLYGGFSQMCSGFTRQQQDKQLKHTRLGHLLTYLAEYNVTVWQFNAKFNVLASSVRDRRTNLLIGNVENRMIDMLRTGMNSAVGGVSEEYVPTGSVFDCVSAARLSSEPVPYEPLDETKAAMMADMIRDAHKRLSSLSPAPDLDLDVMIRNMSALSQYHGQVLTVHLWNWLPKDARKGTDVFNAAAGPAVKAAWYMQANFSDEMKKSIDQDQGLPFDIAAREDLAVLDIWWSHGPRQHTPQSVACLSRLLHLLRPKHIHVYGKDSAEVLVHEGAFINIWDKTKLSAADAFMQCRDKGADPVKPVGSQGFDFIRQIELDYRITSSRYAEYLDRGPFMLQYSYEADDVAVCTLSPYPNSQRYDPTLSLWRKEAMMAYYSRKWVMRSAVRTQISQRPDLGSREAVGFAITTYRQLVDTYQITEVTSKLISDCREMENAVLGLRMMNTPFTAGQMSAKKKKIGFGRSRKYFAKGAPGSSTRLEAYNLLVTESKARKEAGLHPDEHLVLACGETMDSEDFRERYMSAREGLDMMLAALAILQKGALSERMKSRQGIKARSKAAATWDRKMAHARGPFIDQVIASIGDPEKPLKWDAYVRATPRSFVCFQCRQVIFTDRLNNYHECPKLPSESKEERKIHEWSKIDENSRQFRWVRHRRVYFLHDGLSAQEGYPSLYSESELNNHPNLERLDAVDILDSAGIARPLQARPGELYIWMKRKTAKTVSEFYRRREIITAIDRVNKNYNDWSASGQPEGSGWTRNRAAFDCSKDAFKYLAEHYGTVNPTKEPFLCRLMRCAKQCDEYRLQGFPAVVKGPQHVCFVEYGEESYGKGSSPSTQFDTISWFYDLFDLPNAICQRILVEYESGTYAVAPWKWEMGTRTIAKITDKRARLPSGVVQYGDNALQYYLDPKPEEKKRHRERTIPSIEVEAPRLVQQALSSVKVETASEAESSLPVQPNPRKLVKKTDDAKKPAKKKTTKSGLSSKPLGHVAGSSASDPVTLEWSSDGEIPPSRLNVTATSFNAAASGSGSGSGSGTGSGPSVTTGYVSGSTALSKLKRNEPASESAAHKKPKKGTESNSLITQYFQFKPPPL